MKFAFEFKIDELVTGGGVTTVRNNHASMLIENPDECCPYIRFSLCDKNDTIMEFKYRNLNVGIVICTEYAPLNQHHPFIVFRRNPDYSDNFYIRFTLYTEDSCETNDELENFLEFMYEMKEWFHDENLLENEVDLNDPAYKYIRDKKIPFNHNTNGIDHIMNDLRKMEPEKLPTGKYIEPEAPSKSINDLAEFINRPMFTNRDIAQLLAQRNIFSPCNNCDDDDFWED